MEKLIVMIAVGCVCLITLIALIVSLAVLGSVAKASRKKTEEQAEREDKATAETAATEAVEPVQTAKSEQAEVVAEETAPADVAFATDKLTLEERYLKLPDVERGYYDDIVCYAMSIEGHKRFKKATYEEYKIGKNSLVKIKIKNDVIICEIVVPNLDFKNFVSDNKIDVRQAATVIRVTDAASLEAVKGSMDIVVKEIEKEREYKKEQAKQRRRERRAIAKVAVADVTENAETSEESDR